MKQFLKLLLVSLFTSYCFGQKTSKFMGVLKVQDSMVITYKLEFSESNGKISGYSLTDFGGPHETKSKIIGEYNKDKKLLSFKEAEIIYTKSPVSLQDFDFCNVHLPPTRYKLGSEKLMAKFKGRFSDGTECIDGEIAMNSVRKIDKRVTKFTKRVQKSRRVSDSLKEKLRTTKLIDTLNLNVLKKNEITTVITTSPKVKIYVYDGGQIDDDVISILKDNKKLLRNYKITKAKQVVEIPIDSDKVKLKILAESVGTIGSNTAIIEIIDGDKTIKTMTNLNKGETTEIDFLRKPIK